MAPLVQRLPSSRVASGLLGLLLVLACLGWTLDASAQQRCPFHIADKLDAASPQQTGRLRPLASSACGTTKAAPALQGPAATFHYATYALQNRSTSAACVTITLGVTAGSAQSAAYGAAFDPASPRTGYLADVGAAVSGASASYAVTVPALSSFYVTVNATTAAAVSYTLDVTGCGAVVVTGATPIDGPTTGGTAVTITGSGFLAAPQVLIGGAPATNVVVVDQGTLTALTPRGAAGPANLTVTNADATTSTVNAAYDYVVDRTTIALSSSAPSSILGDAIALTAVVVPDDLRGTPTGTVTFLDDGAALGDATLSGSGTATFNVAKLLLGSHVLTARYGGDAVYATCNSAWLAHDVSIGDAGAIVDAGAPPTDDAGESDAGQGDAGSPPDSDASATRDAGASSDAGEAGAADGYTYVYETVNGGGCGCTSAAPSNGGGASAGGWLLALALLAAQKRRARRQAQARGGSPAVASPRLTGSPRRGATRGGTARAWTRR